MLVITRHSHNDEWLGSNFLTDEYCLHLSNMMSVNSSMKTIVFSKFMMIQSIDRVSLCVDNIDMKFNGNKSIKVLIWLTNSSSEHHLHEQYIRCKNLRSSGLEESMGFKTHRKRCILFWKVNGGLTHDDVVTAPIPFRYRWKDDVGIF